MVKIKWFSMREQVSVAVGGGVSFVFRPVEKAAGTNSEQLRIRWEHYLNQPTLR